MTGTSRGARDRDRDRKRSSTRRPPEGTLAPAEASTTSGQSLPAPGSRGDGRPSGGKKQPGYGPARRGGSIAPSARQARDAAAAEEVAEGARSTWQLWYLPLAISLIGLALFLFRITTPDDYTFDEVYHAFTAAQYVEGNARTFDPWSTARDDLEAGLVGHYDQQPGAEPRANLAYEWTHPPLGKQIITIGVWLFGNNPFGWRISSAVFGAISLFIIYRLGLAMTGRWLVGAVAAGLLMMDGLFFVQARTGMVDAHILVFTTGALWAFLRYLRLPESAPSHEIARRLFVTGLLMGCALAVKWNGVYICAFIGLFTVGRLVWLWLRSTSSGKHRASPALIPYLRTNAVWILVYLMAIPALVYLLSYSQMFLYGYTWDQFVELQRQMWGYHSGLVAEHKYASVWWQWPLAAMPVWYGTERFGDVTGYVFAMNNPFVAWATVPAVFAVLYLWWRERRVRWPMITILIIGFFGQWLPWALSPRLSFTYHFLPAVPWGVLAIATLVDRGWRSRQLLWRIPAVAYPVIVVVAFFFFYPIYAAWGLSPDALDLRIWFDNWGVR